MKKTVVMLVYGILLSLAGLAQTGALQGVVKDAQTGNPIEGASISVKGKTGGTTTAQDGSFSLNGAAGQTIVISSIGYTRQEVTAGAEPITVLLQAVNEALTDVVVVGYGTQRRASVTGAQVQLKNTELTRRQVSSASQVLQGLAPGVSVQQQSGRPGADGASIRIRGESSILGNSSPLVIIDGLQMPTATGLDALNQIDPNAIESVTVLKDAASTAIYGTRGAGGVILVKTKRATKEGMKVSYNGFVSKQDFTSIPQRVSAIDHMELSNVAERNRTGNPNASVFPQALIDRYRNNPADNLEIIDTDWLDEVLTNNGLMHNHNIQLVTGGPKLNMFSSFTFFEQQGLMQNNKLRRYDIRINPEFKLNKWLTLTGNFAYNNSITTNPSTGSPEFIIRQAIGLPAIGGGKFGTGMYGTAAQSNNRNPIAMAESAGTSVTNGNTLLTRFGFNLNPIKGLDIEAYWGREKRNPHSRSFIKNVDIYQPNIANRSYDLIGNWPGTTSLSESWRDDVYETYLGQATYQFTIKDDHRIKVLAGAQSELTTQYFFGASRTGWVPATATTMQAHRNLPLPAFMAG